MTKGIAFELLTRVGFIAWGLVYLAIGGLVLFLGRAEGTDRALKSVAAGLGRWALIVIYNIAEAWHRRIHTPDVDHLAGQAAERLSAS